jgi:colanic acid/amylovoran biosynthesis glycosyltransferase
VTARTPPVSRERAALATGADRACTKAPDGSGSPAPATGRIAYLCSEYPAVSHTFVLREVQALRRGGIELDTFSIRRTGPSQLLAPEDREASRDTTAILPPRWTLLLWTHLRLAASGPGTYLATFAWAMRLARPGLRGRVWQCFYFVEAALLWSECRRRGIRHIHVHFANASADIAMLACRIGSAREPARAWSWSFTMHGPTELFDLRHYRLGEKVRDARFVVCISDFARSQLMALSEPQSWGKLHVIHVGLPLEQFTRANDDERRREHARTRAAEQSILCVGRLVPEKGQAVLLEALGLLLERGHNARVLLAGAGQSRASLERLAERLGVAGRVSLLGAVSQQDVRALYEDASIFCLPSFAEGVPVVLMEAMAMELPVVSTRIAGIPELVDDGHSGLLVAPGRADELADALERLLVEPSLGRELACSARRKVLRHFNVESTAAQLQALFTPSQRPGCGPQRAPKS